MFLFIGVPFCHQQHNFNDEKAKLELKIFNLEAKNSKLESKIELLNNSLVEYKKRCNILVTKLQDKTELLLKGIIVTIQNLHKIKKKQILYKQKKVWWKNEDIYGKHLL